MSSRILNTQQGYPLQDNDNTVIKLALTFNIYSVDNRYFGFKVDIAYRVSYVEHGGTSQ